jgi:predicted enzyme related to lactoylglutathione lyase
VPLDLDAVVFDAHDPEALARFWGGLLGWEIVPDGDDAVGLVPHDGTGYWLRFNASTEPKRGPNQIHLELTSATQDQQDETVARALELGGSHLDVGQLPEEGHVVLADPEGNELCVIEPGNSFLAGCGYLGNINGDGSRALGHFWSAVLGWPLVWDQDEETAIRSARGGSKMAWGGPPYAAKVGKVRIHLDVVVSGDGDLDTEVERLLGLGATRLDIGQGDVGWVVLADPDGNELCVRPA